jgi:menaquinone-dependent protoporphyrinogen oxidase
VGGLKSLLLFGEVVLLVLFSLKALIAYATRYGATTGTSEEIGKILRQKGLDVKIVNVKDEKIKDISEYDLIIVASGMRMGKWVSEADDFLKKFQKDFERKKLALFVSTMKTVSEREGKTEDVAQMRKVALEDKVAQYNLHPISLGFFGGVLDYNKMGFLFKRTMGFLKPQLEKDGFQETEPGVYDLRDWDEIRTWVKELAEKAYTGTSDRNT